jgi:predicted unusual protein kinase regulating ubiquinone biosynthesis (AarF/ABC1/UbiB family)
VPVAQADLSTESVLAMEFIDSQPIEALTSAPQATRDQVAAQLIRLVLAEVFDFNLMQTDPNFANFRFSPGDGRIVLLDFGATRSFDGQIAPGLRDLLRAGVAGQEAGVMAVLDRLGFLPPAMSAPNRAEVAALARIGFAPLRQGGVFDFARRDVLAEMRDRGMALGLDRDLWHVPPPDLLFLNRKFGGLYLLATKLAARVDLDPLLAPYLAD